jgi:ATP-dependent Clp protease ATP-binding subunit ClpC
MSLLNVLRAILLPDPVGEPSPSDPPESEEGAAAEKQESRRVAVHPIAAIREQIYAAASAAFEELQRASQPVHLLRAPGFEHCVEVMRRSPLSDADLFGFYSGDTVILAVCAAEAMARRPIESGIRRRVLMSLNDFHHYTRFFALRAITASTPQTESAVGAVLSALDSSWQAPPLREILTNFILERLEAGDPPTYTGLRGEPSDEACENLETLLAPLDEPRLRTFLTALARSRASRVDLAFLESTGSFWPSNSADLLIDHESFAAARTQVLQAITGSTPRAVLVVGQTGTGRSSLIRSAQRALEDREWRIWEAGQLELMAGQSYMGQIEEKIRRAVGELARARSIVWLAPAFESFLFAGRHNANPTSLLDLLMPMLAEGRFPFVGITEPAGFDLLLRTKPTLLTSFEIVRLHPLNEKDSLALARAWDRKRPTPPAAFDDSLLSEASHLAQQYLGDHAGPGNLINLLKQLQRNLVKSQSSHASLDDLIACIAAQTHLPRTILDDREQLQLEHVHEFFSSRVIGQGEAVQTIVERIAMIKAGVTDPSRPMGVFLFAGPTGTGKTEIAKTLAEYLFGSPSRMVRIDMSELQTAESLDRLLGVNQPDQSGQALTDQIRRNPFSVVLLDEFEKAHPQVWDVFLQLFDDGRLTDRRGTVTNFRNCILILTSNLGSAIPRGPGLGFSNAPPPQKDRVEHAMAETFRPELINRIDRLVVFRPLTRDVLREILQKELRAIFDRRGLRNRDWVVIWDDTAVDFLLDRGTTPDLGARPLKRAIEEHVLAPLAKTIVQHQYPHGDQFLFVRGGSHRLEVEFVDPDDNSSASLEAPPAADRHEGLSLAGIAAAAHGTAEEAACLERHLDELKAHLQSDRWAASKDRAFDRQREPGFWDSPERFIVFGLIEQMDRIKAGVAASQRFFERLIGPSPAGRTSFAADQLGRLALRLLTLKIAVRDIEEARPTDAFLMIEATATPELPLSSLQSSVEKLSDMYQAWGERRGIKLERLLNESDPHTSRMVFAVHGLAAHTLLKDESGLHVFEEPLNQATGFSRRHILIRVAPQPEIPPPRGQAGLRQQALDILNAEGKSAAAAPVIVRRYRERPSPLVRDAIRGWRTGRIERVYAGDFDLFADQPDASAALDADSALTKEESAHNPIA